MVKKYCKQINLKIFWILLLFLFCIFYGALNMLVAQVGGGAGSQDSRANINNQNVSIADQQMEQANFSTKKEYSLNAFVNWDKKLLQIKISVPVKKLELQTRYYVNAILESYFSVWLYDSVKNLQINSQQTLKDIWGSTSLKNLYMLLKDILKKKYSVFYPNLKSFSTVYEISLYPNLVRFWADEQFKAEKLPSAVLNANGTEFTGLIIYVQNQLPVRADPYGTKKFKRALFPKIYNENLRLIMNYRNVEKEILLQRGMLSYDMKENEAQHKNFIGSFPFRIVARELFGEEPTDIIISNSDANFILENVYMRKALQQGKILILYDELAF